MRLPNHLLLTVAMIVATPVALASAKEEKLPGKGAAFLEQMREAVKAPAADKLPSQYYVPRSPVERHYAGMLDLTSSFELDVHKNGALVVTLSKPIENEVATLFPRFSQMLKVVYPFEADRAGVSPEAMAISYLGDTPVWSLDTDLHHFIIQPRLSADEMVTGFTVWTAAPGSPTAIPSEK